MSAKARYAVHRVSPTEVRILDLRFGGAEAARVVHVIRVNGSGWKLFPTSTGRVPSRRMHDTPEAAIASMRYMTQAEARAALVSPE